MSNTRRARILVHLRRMGRHGATLHELLAEVPTERRSRHQVRSDLQAMARGGLVREDDLGRWFVTRRSGEDSAPDAVAPNDDRVGDVWHFAKPEGTLVCTITATTSRNVTYDTAWIPDTVASPRVITDPVLQEEWQRWRRKGKRVIRAHPTDPELVRLVHRSPAGERFDHCAEETQDPATDACRGCAGWGIECWAWWRRTGS